MRYKPSMWSRVSLIGLLGIIFSIVMLVTAHTASWASTTPMVAGGYNHTIALKSDGTVWAWGLNDSGQLGDGTAGYSATPVQAVNINLYQSTDTTAPSGSISINSGASYTNSTNVTLTLSATDSVGVTGYYVSDSSATPLASDSGWTSVTSTTSYSGSVSYTLSSGDGEKTVYVWYKDSPGNVSSAASDSITLDAAAPSGSISINSGASYTNSTNVTLTLSATDSVGVTGYYVSDSSATPSSSASGWTSVTSTTSYSGSVSYTISSGDGGKTIYVWYKDSTGNVSSAASDSITLDTTTPSVSITSPTTSTTYTTTSNTISLGGSASDSSSGISEVTWSNSKGGSGTASGTASWTISGISLSTGDNVITVTTKDGAGNSGTDTITVTYNAPQPPKVTTGAATNITSISATLNGTVNANGLYTTAWFQYGKTSGAYTSGTSDNVSVSGSSNTPVSSSISGLSASTTYYYRLVAQNSAGTTYGSEGSFTTSQLPTPAVTTGAATNITSTSATLNGTVNANGLTTFAWFEYGMTSGAYTNSTLSESVSGSGDTIVNSTLSGLSAGTAYYYRLAAQNSAGITYGSEGGFTTLLPSYIGASVDIQDETINLNSTGTFIAEISLASGYDIDDIRCTSIACEGAQAVQCQKYINEQLRVTFNIQDLDLEVDANETKTIEFTITGELENGTHFEGSDSATVKRKPEGGGGRLAGTIIYDDMKVKDAKVTCKKENGSSIIGVKKTNKSGNFNFENLKWGKYRVIIKKKGYKTSTRVYDLNEEDPTKYEDIIVTLKKKK